MGSKKILLFGGSGMLGRELSRSFSDGPYEVIAPSRDAVNISDQKAVSHTIRDVAPDIVVNAAVIVNVDACEAEPTAAYAVNTLGPMFIADTLRSLDLQKTILVQFSSSDIFGSSFDASPSENEEGFSPVNIYSRSKYYAERCIGGILSGSKFPTYIVRASWIYSEFKKTFVDTIAEHVRHPKDILKVANDQRGVPTWGKEIAERTRDLIENRHPFGIYHFVPEINGQEATRLVIAEEIARFFGREDTDRLFSPVPRADIFKTPRPASSAITNTQFPKFPYWKDSLRKYLRGRYP